MSNSYSTRELFLKIMNFEPCKRTLKWEFGYWIGALERWYQEGFEKVSGYEKGLKYGDAIQGPGHPHGSYSWSGTLPDMEADIHRTFKFDKGVALVPYNYWIFPRFEKKVLSEDEKYIEYFDTDGVRKKEYKDKSSMPMFLEFPVKDRKSWERVKEERFSTDSINKRFIGNRKSFTGKSGNLKEPLGILDEPAGFFGSLRWLIGENSLFLLYYDDPGLIKDILGHLCNLWILIAEELTADIEFDTCIFWEDMSGRQGSLISPAAFKEFMAPCYKKIINFLKSRKIKYFSVDTDGNLKDLIPLFLEAGVNSMYPFEQQAGNDLQKIRKSYPELRIMGGINKMAISGNKEAIDKELKKIPALIEEGGFIPFIDHLVPPDISWNNFKYYRSKLNQIIDSTGILAKRNS
jgi:uroporphyrinogen decarboxylase